MVVWGRFGEERRSFWRGEEVVLEEERRSFWKSGAFFCLSWITCFFLLLRLVMMMIMMMTMTMIIVPVSRPRGGQGGGMF